MSLTKLAFVVTLGVVAGTAASARQGVVVNSGAAVEVPRTATKVARGTGLIIGQVLDSENRPVPIPIIILTATSPDGEFAGQRSLADGNGRFIFHGLPRGTFTFSVSCPGYLMGTGYGQRRPGAEGQTLDLADGERVQNIVLRMWRPATISGTVTDEYGDPMVRVEVAALRRTPGAGTERLQFADARVTDDRGMFHIWRLPPGEYLVGIRSVQAIGPATGLAGTEVVTRAGGPPANPSLPPLPSFRVGNSVVSAASTLWSPPPSAEGRMAIYPTTYFPSARSPGQARPLVLSAGENRTGVDIQMKLVSAFRVEGTVTGFDGPITRSDVRLIGAEVVNTDIGSPFSTAFTPLAPNGTFTFPGVPPGQYVIQTVIAPPQPPMPPGSPPQARQPLSIAPTLWAAHPVTVTEADITGLSIALQPGPRVTGQVQFDGAAQRPTPQALARLEFYFQGERGVGNFRPAQVSEAGEIRSDSMPPGQYIVFPSEAGGFGGPGNLAGWFLKSAMLNGRDISDRPLTLERDTQGLVVTFTDKPNQVSGTVRNASGTADPTAMVVLVPQDRTRWNQRAGRSMRTARVSTTGRYSMSGVPPGDYLIAAVDDQATLQWPNPAWIESVSRLATTIAVGADERKVVDLRTTTVR